MDLTSLNLLFWWNLWTILTIQAMQLQFLVSVYVSHMIKKKYHWSNNHCILSVQVLNMQIFMYSLSKFINQYGISIQI